MAISSNLPDTSLGPPTVLRVLDFEAAVDEVLRHAAELRGSVAGATEEVPLLESAGRMLARAIVADRDQPPFDRSTRDGFAVRATAFSAGGWLSIVGQVRAGDVWSGPPLADNEAIEIMTGAPLPAGADAVTMVEHVELDGGNIRAQQGRRVSPGENVVPQGSEARAGEVVVAVGSTIGAAEIALAATAGESTLAVAGRPSVAIVATGDELVELHETPNSRQIRNSNGYALATLVHLAGALPYRLAIARDVREELLQRIAEARQHDLILFSGGVSMGKYDLVEEVLAELGAEFFFTGVKMQPGKPIVFGRLPERRKDGSLFPARYFFGLPGNPVSTQVTFHCFVEPSLRTMLGEDVSGPRFAQATLAHDVEGKQGLTRMLPARLESDFRQASVRLVGWQGSGDLAANARANCYAVFPPDRTEFRAGDVISVLLR
ncbi:molybdopterin molybdotransferase [Granulicella aggregans]|uniref:Molybdopterin molybdenumtransferase n=1 Tax=Granulicella aggregans TaxID=474949 RepID=A0A7W7Z9V4_9BACT|nr:gephyrin-like molybdotransferase Glp [Granulicella aggregans]MBB5055950.1 molybdopterin molybdotransferase [Granulicella aggregans]